MLLYTHAFYYIEMCMCIFFAYVYHVGAWWRQMATTTFSCAHERVLYNHTLGHTGFPIGTPTSTISLPCFQSVHEYFLHRLYFLPKIVPKVVFLCLHNIFSL